MRPPQARDESAAPGRAPGSGVQVIITSPGRNLAVIDGVVVPLGAAVRNGTLSSISDSLAVLKKNGGHDVLLMHPDIDKKPARRERP